MTDEVGQDAVRVNALRESAMLRAIDPAEPIGLKATPVWVEARTASGWVLLGGLGGLGVGVMWAKEEERHKTYTGYASAQIVGDDWPVKDIVPWPPGRRP